MIPPRNIARDLLILTALCAAMYAFGLTAHGLTNWQEAQRALVAREMQSRGDWIVPTVDGRPYLAKPPMIYWTQLGLASVRGVRTGEFELRLTVALAGWLGVLAAYLVARRMFNASVAWWSSLFLATGFLYVRSSRIGELDILLAPFTILAIGAIYQAWRVHTERGRTNIPAVIVAALAATGAMLTKGPPALLAIGLAGYGGIAAWEAWRPRDNNGITTPGPARPRPERWFAATAALVVMAASAWLSRDELRGPADWIGLAVLGIMGALVGATLARLARPRPLRDCFAAYARTHPIAVLGLPFLALWGWGKLVAARIGPEAVANAVRLEAADNLRLLVPGSPLNNLEAAAYAVGLGSVFALIAVIWIVWKRQQPTRELWIILAWAIGGIIGFSILGKGVNRYLTPVWPGIAILGGWGFVQLLGAVRSSWRLTAWTWLLIAAAVIGQAWWYGSARERWHPERVPRAFLAELLSKPGVEASKLAMFEFDTPAVDFYAGSPVESVHDVVPRPGVVGVGPRTLADLRRDMERDGGSRTLLIRRTQPADMDPLPAAERLAEAGFRVEPIALESRFVIDNQRTDVEAVRISPSKP